MAYAKDVTPERPHPVRMFGDNFVLWRGTAGARVHAAIDECLHRAARLSQGWIDVDTVVVDGRVVVQGGKLRTGDEFGIRRDAEAHARLLLSRARLT